MTAVITITSGSRESSKSILSANLALYLTRQGYRSAVLAAGGQEPLWGIPPASTWPNVITGHLPLAQIIHQSKFGIDIIVAQGHGHALGQFSNQHDDHVTEGLADLDAYAYLIVDLAGGITAAAMACCMASTENILMLAANSPALTAAYEWLSHLAHSGFSRPVNLILNQVRKPAHAKSAYIRFRDLVHNRLDLKTNLWGSIGYEPSADLPESLSRPLAELMPQSKIIQDIHSIGDRLLAEQPPENQTVGLVEFWRQFNHHLQQLPLIPIQSSKKPDPGVQPSTTDGGFEELDASDTPCLQDARDSLLESLNCNLSRIFKELRAIRQLLENSHE